MEKRIVLKNETDTRTLGAKLAAQMKPDQVYALIGDLGTGKTTLAKAIARGLGVTETLTSPTFTIVQEYGTGRLPLYHFDVYRVNDEDELFEIGLEDYFHKGGVCLIEWADLIEDLLPEGAVTIRLAYGEEEGERICSIAR
jgi:tRNA threonylcarbamoyladenosine biosynthesis protein TsaE